MAAMGLELSAKCADVQLLFHCIVVAYIKSLDSMHKDGTDMQYDNIS